MAVPDAALEAVAETPHDHPGVDLDRADIVSIQAGIGLQVDIPGGGVQGPVIVDQQIDTHLTRSTPGAVQIQIAQSTFLTGEAGVVDAHPDIRLYISLGATQRVVLQGQGWRQMLGGSQVLAAQLDVMLERFGGQQLDAQLVMEAVTQSKGKTGIVLNINIQIA